MTDKVVPSTITQINAASKARRTRILRAGLLIAIHDHITHNPGVAADELYEELRDGHAQVDAEIDHFFQRNRLAITKAELP